MSLAEFSRERGYSAGPAALSYQARVYTGRCACRCQNFIAIYASPVSSCHLPIACNVINDFPRFHALSPCLFSAAAHDFAASPITSEYSLRQYRLRANAYDIFAFASSTPSIGPIRAKPLAVFRDFCAHTAPRTKPVFFAIIARKVNARIVDASIIGLAFLALWARPEWSAAKALHLCTSPNYSDSRKFVLVPDTSIAFVQRLLICTCNVLFPLLYCKILY